MQILPSKYLCSGLKDIMASLCPAEAVQLVSPLAVATMTQRTSETTINPVMRTSSQAISAQTYGCAFAWNWATQGPILPGGQDATVSPVRDGTVRVGLALDLPTGMMRTSTIKIINEERYLMADMAIIPGGTTAAEAMVALVILYSSQPLVRSCCISTEVMGARRWLGWGHEKWSYDMTTKIKGIRTDAPMARTTLAAAATTGFSCAITADREEDGRCSGTFEVA